LELRIPRAISHFDAGRHDWRAAGQMNEDERPAQRPFR
jgi:hypothetical protein